LRAGLLAPLQQLPECRYTTCVDERNEAHAQNEQTRWLQELAEDLIKAAADGQKKRPGNLVELYAGC